MKYPKFELMHVALHLLSYFTKGCRVDGTETKYYKLREFLKLFLLEIHVMVNLK